MTDSNDPTDKSHEKIMADILKEQAHSKPKNKQAAYEMGSVHKSIRLNKEKDAELLKFLEENKADFNFNQFVKTKLYEELRRRKLKKK